MNKLVLTAALATVIAVPAAMADCHKTHKNKADYVSPRTATVTTTTTTTKVAPQAHVTRIPVGNGDYVSVEGRKVYYLNANSSRYFAPSGTYASQDGTLFQSADGLLLWSVGPSSHKH